MQEAERIVIPAMDDTAEQESIAVAESSEKPSDSGGSKGPGGNKKPKKGEWFKRVVSGLIAIVTIVGALVAWRAAVAGNESGNNDSVGLLALQNAEQTKAVSVIQANGDEMGYVNYLRNRIISQKMLNDDAASNAPPELQNYIARQITETIDLGNTSKFYFFPSNYLNQNDEYDWQREVDEATAQAQQSMDLNYQQHFDTSDALSNKSMFLLAMLIVLAVSLWLLAASEVIISAVKYVTAAGGLLFMILGGLGAYLVDAGQASQGDVGAVVWPTSLALGALTLLAVLAAAGLVLVRGRTGRRAARPAAQAVTTPPTPRTPPYVPPAQPPSPPQYPPAGYGQGQPPAPGGPLYGPPPPTYAPPPPTYGPPPPAYGPPPPGYQPTPPAQPVQVQPTAAVPAARSGAQAGAPAKTAQVKKSASESEGEDEKEEVEEPFKRIVTVMIATVALIAALVAYLQADASNQSGSANRNAQQYATQALGERTYGTSEMTYQNQAIMQTWKQLEVLASSAENHDDQAAAARYRDAADQIKGLSGIFDPKYFDPNTQDLPNDSAFAADLYNTQAVGLTQRSIVQRGLHDVWSAKASAYIAHLTLLAVALALFGLALATSSFVRYVLVGAGVLIVGAAVVWAIATYGQPVTTISDDAVDAYARGYGFAQSGHYDDAINAYSDALKLQPDYGDALYERGNVYFSQATDAYSKGYYQEGAGQTADAQASYKLATSLLENSAKDYEAARAAGRDDMYVGWNLGWTYYVLGRFDDAVQADRRVLDKDPSVVPVRLNLGLALIAQGKDTDAEQEYNTAIARTSDQINNARDRGQTVSSDFWYYLDAGAGDLYNLMLRAQNISFAFTQAPSQDKIANSDDAKQEAFDMMTKLRDKTTAFEYLAKNGQMPPESQVSASIEQPTFGATVEGKSDEVTGLVFPYNTRSVNMYYTYKGIQKGEVVTFKIYRNYNHIPEYDYTVDNWQNDESGDRQFVVTDPSEALSEYYYLSPGLWTVEMYVDYQLQQIGNFYIENYDETQQEKSQSTGTPSETPTPTP